MPSRAPRAARGSLTRISRETKVRPALIAGLRFTRDFAGPRDAIVRLIDRPIGRESLGYVTSARSHDFFFKGRPAAGIRFIRLQSQKWKLDRRCTADFAREGRVAARESHASAAAILDDPGAAPRRAAARDRGLLIFLPVE